MIEERFDPDRTVLSLSFLKSGEKAAKKVAMARRKKRRKNSRKVTMLYLNAMQPGCGIKLEFENYCCVKVKN